MAFPPYRLPNQVLDDEVNDIVKLGVEIQYNMRLGENIMLDQLQDDFDATFPRHWRIDWQDGAHFRMKPCRA